MVVKPCKFCGLTTHYNFQCYQNPKRGKYRLPKAGKVSFAFRKTREVWFQENEPNAFGYYECYICLKWLLPIETTLDHVKPRGSHPELRFEPSNLKPCCAMCNTKKGSKGLETLVEEYPHLRELIE